VLASSSAERAISEQIQGLTEAGSPAAPTKPIDETPRSIESILAEWRAAERRLAAAEVGSAEATEIEILIERLREEYRSAHDEARGHSR
jgi:hypothetical protein